ncbi:MAG: sensor histidine kinase [Waterburya sp.]
MSSSNLSLNDFVCLIPICQPEADVGSILRIFQQTSCDLLAVPLENNIWGTISAPKLLSLLAQVWQQQASVMVGHPKNVTYYQRHVPIGQDWNCLIKPAIVYQAETKLQEFLSHLSNSSLVNSQQVYLIVDAAGQLKGKLNLEAILKHLALKSNQPQNQISKLPVLSTSLLSWIDSLALPFKIETFEGKDFYLNKYWQELISTPPDQDSPKPDISLANWWIEQKLTQSENYQVHSTPQVSSVNYHCANNNYQTLSQSNTLTTETNLTFDSEPISLYPQSSEVWEHEHLNQASTTGSLLDIQIKKVKDWYQIKIPITLVENQVSDSNTSVYWLILAAKLSTTESSESQSLVDPTSVSAETIINKLLNTVSHELKSPLTGIVGLSNLLQTAKLGNLNQRQTRYVRLIYNSGQKMMSIVNDLLEFTSLTTGKLELKPETINLEVLCRQVYQQVLTKLQSTIAATIEPVTLTSLLKFNIESGLEIAIADKLRLSSIISHLILEIIQRSDVLNPLTIEIKSYQESTAITVSNSSSLLSTDLSLFKSDSDLNLMIATYLAEALNGEVISTNLASNCQLTLLLPASSSQLVANLNPTVTTKQNFTILCLYPEPEVINSVLDQHRDLDFNLKSWIEQDWSNNSEQQPEHCYRVIEADGLEQAHMLARIWHLDAIVIDGYHIADPTKYLRSLQESEYLSNLPLITLDTRTTEAANQIPGLSVYPCLLPAECRSVKDLIQVIQIATNA